MKINIIPEDGVVVRDGRAVRSSAFAPLMPKTDLHAAHWDSALGAGEEELLNPTVNEVITDFSPYQAVMDEYQRIIDKEDAPPTPPTLDERKELMKDFLYGYYDRYTHSEFVIGPSTFNAHHHKVQQWQLINSFVKEDPANVDYFVVDKFDEVFPINKQTTWNTFWGAYKGLFTEARGIVRTSWQEVRDATTIAEVDAVLDTLPPIPGDELPPGAV